jgi:hypothetical protein
MFFSVGLLFLVKNFFGCEKVTAFILFWIFTFFQVGQYSMRFPKAF